MAKSADEKKKKRIVNTVQGHRRGSKYPEETRTAALAMMLTSNNISDVKRRLAAVAKRYDVPESTLRGWYNAAMRELAAQKNADAAEKTAQEAQKSEFAKARTQAIKDITQTAARGAMLTAEMMVKRAEMGGFRAKLRDTIINDLILLGPCMPGESAEAAAMRVKLIYQLKLQEPMSDTALNKFTQTLYDIGFAQELRQGETSAALYEEYLDRVTGDEF